MIIKVFLISLVLLAIMFLGFGVKLLIKKDDKLSVGSCNTKHNNSEWSCGCGGGNCATGNYTRKKLF